MTDTPPPAGTTLPRWTIAGQAPEAGFDRHRVSLPPELVGALCGRADELGVELAAVLFAAHLKVLAALTSERELVTGRRTNTGTAAHAATVADGSWAELVAEAARAATAPLDPVAETVLDLRTGEARPPEPDTVLAVHYDADLTMTLTYRRDAITADHAERIGGYVLTALGSLAADPQAAHHERTLLSDEEIAFQLGAFRGPDRPLPDRLFVELFEEQVALRPDDPAASHGEQRWTYRELNERANRIAHALLERGLGDEDVVAVVMDRNLHWLAATLAVLKAGGVYLPVRPDFPAGRVANQLERSDCRFAVTEAGSEELLHAAVTEAGRECRTVLAAEAAAATDSAGAGNPGRAIAPGQLAYIYFTSGSTGAPKGAMCEHEGMLNHLYAKLDDMELTAGEVVTQIASQCFDISLWQLLAPLLAGGSTTIVDTELQLDVERFIGLLADGGIQVIQIVPAYLDVMLSNLEKHPRALGDLRSVSVTGEALKVSLVKRWFALYPDIRLVNAYGATEVSDDTMHAVLDRVPERDLAVVNVGRSLRNVDTYILDEQLRAVPLGAPGEIAFSGVCVGRGYINDPDRTAQAFTTDPFKPGVRLYRTGDYGRWLPEGTIEFLGRRDEQVKVRGFRIEIGEIENRLLQMPGVAETAVVIAGAGDATKNLVAFHTGSDQLQSADLRDFLAAALPDYMVPSHFHRLESLPLTENGKTDKKLLTARAEELGQDVAGYVPPATETERRLATAWAEVLNVLVGRIGRDDDFFRLGGTSLAAVRLVVKLDRLISLRDLVARPVLRDLAAAIDAAAPDTADDLLQQLSAPTADTRATLVCFPYAGGNAVNFQQLARELAPLGIAVSAVELPGHDLSRPDEPLADVAEIARRVQRGLPDGPVLLWGHCAGAAYAVELARLLEGAGRPAERVFLAALLLDDPAELRRESAEVSALGDAELIARLQDDSAYVELDLMKSERAGLVGRAYRHDVRSTNDYLIALQDGSAPVRLGTPVEVVAAADDPTTREPGQRYKLWEQAVDTLTLHLLDEGGHYFARTRAAEVAALVSVLRPQA
ncbi:non-ribosomal peptide synthetase [Streptomyces sp. 1331.2]|uniref:non-ribosomal peptide synthetase n=1 Tax=Streptomyces sp. 1331.2 TaxID=1938835 RepID=UPI000BD85355|nr:amino acid adenylation domain-containing protein [Streptomyces sp. 1331.2]SOB83280.1 amino acid adenylation domain-containing protein [Streptomyces sp. 1331.2]